MPISASVRHEVIRLDGVKLSPDSVERIVTRAMSQVHVPGLALAVINRGEVVYMAASVIATSSRSFRSPPRR